MAWFGRELTKLDGENIQVPQEDEIQEISRINQVIRQYIAQTRIPRKIKQKEYHDKQSFVRATGVKLGDLVVIKDFSKLKHKFDEKGKGPFQVIGTGASKTFVIINKIGETEKIETALKDVEPYLIYMGHIKIFKSAPDDFAFDVGTTDFHKSKYNKQKYYNHVINSFPVEILEQDEVSKIFFVKYASGEVGMIALKKQLHPALLKKFRKKIQQRMRNGEMEEKDFGVEQMSNNNIEENFEFSHQQFVTEEADNTEVPELIPHEEQSVQLQYEVPPVPVIVPQETRDIHIQNEMLNQTQVNKPTHISLPRDVSKDDVVYNSETPHDPRNVLKSSKQRKAKVNAKPKIRKIYRRK